MIRLQGQGLSEIVSPLGQRLSRCAEDQVQRNLGDPLSYSFHGARRFLRTMAALQGGEDVRLKRLRSEADAGDAVFGEDAYLVRVEGVGVRLDRELAVRLQRQPGAEVGQQPRELG